jgi:hypothetical protein
MKEHNIDCMKHRKHTHLAGVDVAIITSEKGRCILTIKDAYFSRGVDVSGNKTDGYFLEFEEDVMPMVVNSSNRKMIANNLVLEKGLSLLDSRNIGNWIGTKIELQFDETIRMMGKVVGGIRVKGFKVLPDLLPNTSNFEAVKKALDSKQYTIDQVKIKYNISEEVAKLLNNDGK